MLVTVVLGRLIWAVIAWLWRRYSPVPVNHVYASLAGGIAAAALGFWSVADRAEKEGTLVSVSPLGVFGTLVGLAILGFMGRAKNEGRAKKAKHDRPDVQEEAQAGPAPSAPDDGASSPLSSSVARSTPDDAGKDG